MKQKLKRRNRLLILGVCLSLIFYQCQQDDLQTIEEQNNLETTTIGQKTNKLISGKDIPEILDFVKQQTNDRLQVKLSNLTDNTRQADLPIGNLSTDIVKQVTNQYGRSNYTFAMVKDVDTGELSYINYVVKDTRYGMYSYFVEYIPEILIQHQSDPLPEANGYSGEIRIYNQYGVYIGSNTFENGNKTSDHYKHSCDNDTDGGSGGGGGNTGDGTGPSGPSSGDGSGSGGGGVDITLVCGEVYLQQIDCPPNCECTACYIEVQDCDIIVRTSDDYYNKTGKRDPLRHPCPPIDNSDQNCRCPDDVPDGQTDVDPSDENPSGGVLLDLLEIVALNQFLEPNLTLEQIELITELDISDELLDYLENNVDPDDPITFEEALNTIRPCNLYNNLANNQEFKDKMQTLQNLAQTDNKETAFKMTADGNGGYNFSDPIEGEANSDGLDPQVGEDDVIDGFIHNHYDREGSLSIFSPHDLYSLYNWLTNGNIGNIATFVYAVTTSDNTTYAITITDPDAFIAFGDIALEGLQFEEPTNDFMIHEYNGANGSFLEQDGGVKGGNTNDLNEKNLIKLLDAANAGIKVFTSNSNFENWQQLNFNSSTNSITPQNCN